MNTIDLALLAIAIGLLIVGFFITYLASKKK